ncbi:Ornithine decarboxylase 1 [Oryzias melastigma]|uniref:ornithine decarboxylase n=1 Tax=Oryzias melastigma TaxID=30732 RepID=A0A834C2F4_ORYME|nr:Ornithine decarboxylase 1 [Oryzias melastigma]
MQTMPSILGDDRFKRMFENPDYQVDEQSEEFRLLNPIVSKAGQKRKKKLRQLVATKQVAKDIEEPEGQVSSEEESSDDDKSWLEEVRKQRRLLRQEDKHCRRQERKEIEGNAGLLEKMQNRGKKTPKAPESKKSSQPQFYQIKCGEEFRSFNEMAHKQKIQKASLEDRLKLEEQDGLSVADTAVGSKQITFTLKKSDKQMKQQQAEHEHNKERKKLRRSAGQLKSVLCKQVTMNTEVPRLEFSFLEEGFSAWDIVEQKINELSLTDDRDAFYVCDLGDVLKKHLRWTRGLPRVTPFYAVKCNDSRAVVMTLASLGTGFDCASKSLGVHPCRIIYANPCKQVSQMKYASAQGVQMMTFDSEVELMKVARYHDNAK